MAKKKESDSVSVRPPDKRKCYFLLMGITCSSFNKYIATMPTMGKMESIIIAALDQPIARTREAKISPETEAGKKMEVTWMPDARPTIAGLTHR